MVDRSCPWIGSIGNQCRSGGCESRGCRGGRRNIRFIRSVISVGDRGRSVTATFGSTTGSSGRLTLRPSFRNGLRRNKTCKKTCCQISAVEGLSERICHLWVITMMQNSHWVNNFRLLKVISYKECLLKVIKYKYSEIEKKRKGLFFKMLWKIWQMKIIAC